jgi:hypothetical protein
VQAKGGRLGSMDARGSQLQETALAEAENLVARQNLVCGEHEVAIEQLKRDKQQLVSEEAVSCSAALMP